jgi:hypothetical protein
MLDLMGETEESPTHTDATPTKYDPIPALNSQPKKAEKLLDAGLLVFLATAISLGTSTLYVWGLSWTLRFPIQSYFGLKDYLEVTTYWLGPVLGYAVWMGYQNFASILSFFQIKKREPGQKWLPWFWSKYWNSLLLAAILLTVSFAYDWLLALSGWLVAFGTFAAFFSARGVTRSYSSRITSRWLRYSIILGIPIATFALLLGLLWTPASLNHEKASDIYLLNDKSDPRPTLIKGKILFSLTQYLITLRDDDVFVVVPNSRIERIETPKDQPSAKPSVPAASTTPTPLPTLAASPSPTATVSVSPSSTATTSVSPSHH